MDIDRSDHRKWLHELVHEAAISRLHDHVQGMLGVDHRLAQDLDPMPPHVGAAQMIQKHGSHLGVAGGAGLSRVLVLHDEQRHCSPPVH